jgi:hypothetical protein
MAYTPRQPAAPGTTEEKPTFNRSFYGSGKFRFAIYPDYWKDSWGKPPLLGHVWADDEFYAVREAYNRKLLTLNYTFRPRAVKVPTPASKW